MRDALRGRLSAFLFSVRIARSVSFVFGSKTGRKKKSRCVVSDTSAFCLRDRVEVMLGSPKSVIVFVLR